MLLTADRPTTSRWAPLSGGERSYQVRPILEGKNRGRLFVRKTPSPGSQIAFESGLGSAFEPTPAFARADSTSEHRDRFSPPSCAQAGDGRRPRPTRTAARRTGLRWICRPEGSGNGFAPRSEPDCSRTDTRDRIAVEPTHRTVRQPGTVPRNTYGETTVAPPGGRMALARRGTRAKPAGGLEPPTPSLQMKCSTS